MVVVAPEGKLSMGLVVGTTVLVLGMTGGSGLMDSDVLDTGGAGVDVSPARLLDPPPETAMMMPITSAITATPSNATPAIRLLLGELGEVNGRLTSTRCQAAAPTEPAACSSAFDATV